MIALGTGSLLYDAATGLPANAAYTASMAQFDKEHGGPISCLAWSPDGTRLALGFAELGQVLLTDTASGGRLPLRTVHSGWVRSMAFSPDGTRLATCGRDRTVKLLDARSLDLLLVFKEHRTDVRTLAWSPDGRALWSADVEGNVVVRRLP
jgi:WD40 repeat protein